MKPVTAIVLLGLAMCTPVLAQKKSQLDDGPSLKDTFDWMKSTLKSQGSTYPIEQLETSYVLFAGEEAFKRFFDRYPRDTTCLLHFLQTKKWIKQPKDCPECQGTEKEEIIVDLTDIDPARIVLFKKDAVLAFTTTDLQPKITVLVDPVGNSDKFEHYSEMSRSMLVLEDHAYAERFAKAFEHAVKLCGGKHSMF